jgi:transglutaminase-like putative cysteine protease
MSFMNQVYFYLKNIFLILLFTVIMPIQIKAQSEFQTDYDVDYSINPQGVTIVTQKISLTNLETNIYPKQYSITLDTDKIRNVIAYDGKGLVSPVITQTDGKTQILLKFNDRVVGLGKHLDFMLRFENTDIAKKNGEIWEINIPGISDSPNLGIYSVSLETPPTFGENAYVVPPPNDDRKWSKKQMITGGISAAYGKEQFFSVNLTYHLENTDLTNRITEIALPPDTAFQKVSIRSINPSPINVNRDPDGNWLARYSLPPKSVINVTVNVIVSLTINPRSEYGKEQIIQDDMLKSTTYWQSQDPLIMGLAQSHRTPKEIYDYLVNTMAYDYNRVNANPIRKGAVKALEQPKNSVCMEFTDAFIAIARAAGIPARQVVGYAYTTNTKLRPLSLITDVMHAWPEYYDNTRQLWIGIDPTWANTTGGIDYFNKLDFNHIVFAINGLKDNYPYPAGSYRDEEKPGKFVNVEFADAQVAKHLTPKINTSINFPRIVISGLSAKGDVTIKNTTGVGINDIAIAVDSKPTDLHIIKTLDHLPPFTEVSLPFVFSTHSLFVKSQGIINVSVNRELSTYSFQIRPMYIFAIFGVLIAIGLLFIIWKVFINRK